MQAFYRCVASIAFACVFSAAMAQTGQDTPTPEALGYTKAPDSVKSKFYLRKRPDGTQILVVIDGAEQLAPEQTTEPVPVPDPELASRSTRSPATFRRSTWRRRQAGPPPAAQAAGAGAHSFGRRASLRQ